MSKPYVEEIANKLEEIPEEAMKTLTQDAVGNMVRQYEEQITNMALEIDRLRSKVRQLEEQLETKSDRD